MELLTSIWPTTIYLQQIPSILPSSASLSSFPSLHRSIQSHSFHRRLSCTALKTGSNGGKIGSHEVYSHELLRKPIISPPVKVDDQSVKEPVEKEQEVVIAEEESDGKEYESDGAKRKRWVDWEDKILEDTVPLVGFVRMILHSGKYQSGERLSPEHQKTIMEKLLSYHPECEKKIGCGIDYITIGYHPDFEESRCLFIVRIDGEFVDFSYWKCIKGLIRKKYPLYADSFIFRHFRRRRR